MKRIASNLDRQPSPETDFTLTVEARDFLAVHLPKLTDKQQRVLIAWSIGKSASEIAAAEGISVTAAHERIACALRRLRQIATDGGGKHACAGKCRCR